VLSRQGRDLPRHGERALSGQIEDRRSARLLERDIGQRAVALNRETDDRLPEAFCFCSSWP
jgi:hypothetical protein